MDARLGLAIPVGLRTDGFLTTPFELRLPEDVESRAIGDEDRGGFVDCLRPVAPADIVLDAICFFGAADIFASVVLLKTVGL